MAGDSAGQGARLLDAQGRLGEDCWQPCEDDSPPAPAQEGGRMLLRPAAWRQWMQGGGADGGFEAALWIWPDDPDQDWQDLLAAAGAPATIALHFPALADGRAFSLAQLLRRHHRYRGEILATGPFLPDQASFLFRCGFSRLQFDRADRAATAQELLRPFAETYQAKFGSKAP